MQRLMYRGVRRCSGRLARCAFPSSPSALYSPLVQSTQSCRLLPQLKSSHFESQWRFSVTARLFLGLAFCLALFGLCCGAIASADTWWHLATGRWIVEHHAVPHTDPFSYATAGKPWVAHEYLTDILMFFLHRAGGFIALATVERLRADFGLRDVALSARAPSLGSPMPPLCSPLSCSARIRAAPAIDLPPVRRGIPLDHPRISARSSAEWLVALPCLMLLWVQLHAGYLLGIGLRRTASSG